MVTPAGPRVIGMRARGGEERIGAGLRGDLRKRRIAALIEHRDRRPFQHRP